VDKLIEAVIDLVANTPPDKAAQLADAVRKLRSSAQGGSLSAWAANPNARARLNKLVAAWRATSIPSAELSGMIAGAGAAYHQARAEQEIELV
jgi:hypothetical protein